MMHGALLRDIHCMLHCAVYCIPTCTESTKRVPIIICEPIATYLLSDAKVKKDPE
jgi:hypothetical protein